MKIKLPEIACGEMILENILYVSVLEWEVSQVGCKIYGTKDLEVNQSRNSLVGL